MGRSVSTFEDLNSGDPSRVIQGYQQIVRAGITRDVVSLRRGRDKVSERLVFGIACEECVTVGDG